MPTPKPVRCRQIQESDRQAVAALLARGFPGRPERYWTAALARLSERDVPQPYPRFGYMLECDAAPVGVVLMIVTVLPSAGAPRCNLSSWYVEPAFRAYAAQLGMQAFKHRAATFINVSAAPNTWATIEAQGFARYTAGQVLALLWLGRADPALTVAPFCPDGSLALLERDLLDAHASYGCLSLVGRGPDGAHPFVFLPMRARRGRFALPAAQLIYCRAVADVARFAVPLGHHLLKRGYAVAAVDADGPVAGLPGPFWSGRMPRFVKGPDRPRLGDLAYTEFAMFGA